MGVDKMGVHQMGVDQMGVHQMGVDQMGVDEMGTHHSNKAVSDVEDLPLPPTHTHTHTCMHHMCIHMSTYMFVDGTFFAKIKSIT